MGPESTKSFPGQAIVDRKSHAERAKQAIDHGLAPEGVEVPDGTADPEQESANLSCAMIPMLN